MHLTAQLSSLSFPGYKALKGEGIVGLDPVIDLRPCADQNALDEVSRQILQRGLLREIPTGRKGRLYLVIKYTIGLHQVTQRLERIGVNLALMKLSAWKKLLSRDSGPQGRRPCATTGASLATRHSGGRSWEIP